jgi:peptide/nickel transport system permease protein
MTIDSNTTIVIRTLPASRQKKSYMYIYQKLFGGDPLAFLGLFLLLILFSIAIFGPLMVRHDPVKTSSDVLVSPNSTYWFGSDQYGRDIFSRVITSLRLDFVVAITGVSGAILFGVILGAVCGYVGGRFDDIVMRLVDIIQSFPLLILAMTLVVILGTGVTSVVIITVLINIPVYARLIRGDTLSKKRLEYIDAARCSGCTESRILFRHLLPNIISPLIVQGSLNLAWAMGNIAALSFLGMGISPPTPDLGLMVAEGTKYLTQQCWWMSVFPGLVLALAIFAFNMVGDGLQDRFDPRQNRG